jgi:hypothetical protein
MQDWLRHKKRVSTRHAECVCHKANGHTDARLVDMVRDICPAADTEADEAVGRGPGGPPQESVCRDFNPVVRVMLRGMSGMCMEWVDWSRPAGLEARPTLRANFRGRTLV